MFSNKENMEKIELDCKNPILERYTCLGNPVFHQSVFNNHEKVKDLWSMTYGLRRETSSYVRYEWLYIG